MRRLLASAHLVLKLNSCSDLSFKSARTKMQNCGHLSRPLHHGAVWNHQLCFEPEMRQY